MDMTEQLFRMGIAHEHLIIRLRKLGQPIFEISRYISIRLQQQHII